MMNADAGEAGRSAEMANTGALAVMFDVDGTLLDTLEDITRCVNACLEAVGDPPRSRDEVQEMVGDGVDSLCRRALNRPTAERVARMVERIRAYYQTTPVQVTAPYPGIPELLERLRARRLPLAVLSNRPQAMTEILVKRFFPEGCFERIVGESGALPRKPDPAGALWIARSMNIAPVRWIYVGDSPVDVQTGRAAGMATVAVTWGFRSEDKLRSAGPDVVAHSPEEVYRFISWKSPSGRSRKG